MNHKVMFSSKSDQWETPQEFFDRLNEEFRFDLDVCANETNHKCKLWIDQESDALKTPWRGRCWMNPPYGREIGKFVVRAAEQVECGNAELVCCLLPARTDTKWFHDYIYRKCEIRFVAGRLKFGGAKNSAPFPSMVCIFRQKVENALEGGKQDESD